MSPAHASCSQDYDTGKMYAHIIWSTEESGKESETEGGRREGEERWGHSWKRESLWKITADGTMKSDKKEDI